MKIRKRMLCWLLLLVFIGSMCACSDNGQENSGRDPAGMEEQIGENSGENDLANTPEEQPDDGAGTEDESVEGGEANASEAQSNESEALRSRAEQFAKVYFSRNVDSIPAFLADNFTGEFKAVYPFDGTVTEYTIKGLDTALEADVGTTKTVSVEFKDSEQDDSYLYLTIEFIKQEDGWKVQFYGLEK